ncbi:MAG: penicillin acylase family protein [Ferruginibacter sp.]
MCKHYFILPQVWLRLSPTTKISWLFLLLFCIFLKGCSSPTDTIEIKRLKELATHVTITRDNWGIPHIYGHTDGDAVFGLMYAQCEESFERVERNYLQVLGRMSETESGAYLYQDLEMKILYDTTAAKKDYEVAPASLKKLLHAFADGINFYLYIHPDTKPKAITHFEPWFPLMFTDGAYISTNTGGLQLEDIKALYGKDNWLSVIQTGTLPKTTMTSTGSNGFAIAPSRSSTGNAMLYINPHVSFFFRTEVHIMSDEGLNAYGAATWGQFFIFQGFNEHCGWMHTSSMADVADLYAEKITKSGDSLWYEYDSEKKAVTSKKIFITHKTYGINQTDSLLIYYTHHGPVMGSRNGKWLSLKEHNRSLEGLQQSWQRMKASGLVDFKNSLQLKGNTSTNTLFADDKGNIAYWHGNYLPLRDTTYNWALPVDGSLRSTEWKGLIDIDHLVNIVNPSQGFIQNCNSSPYSVSGFHSIPKENYATYMAPEPDNFRSIRAIEQLQKETSFTMDKLIALGYDHYLGIFDSLLPPLLKAYDGLPINSTFRLQLQEPVSLLRNWDKRSSVSSVATTVAVFWAGQFLASGNVKLDTESGLDQVKMVMEYNRQTTAQQKLEGLNALLVGLQRMYGKWKVPWGEVNRFQRTTGAMAHDFTDDATSLPVGLVSAFYGSLPAFETTWKDTKKQYGVAGNSFVAVVEFGKKLKARSIVAGGQSFDPASKHFNDQAEMFINGKLKDVHFYKEDVEKNKERRYHPGEEEK